MLSSVRQVRVLIIIIGASTESTLASSRTKDVVNKGYQRD